MCRLPAFLIAVGLMAAPAAEGQAQDRIGPVVIRSEPVSGAELVDPGRKELSVTFDRPMKDGSWSWVSVGAPFPARSGPIRYLADHRTCVLPVVMEAGVTYVVGINYGNFSNFMDAAGRPALPWVLTFTTAPALATSATAAAEPAVAERALGWAKDLKEGRTGELMAHFDDAMKAGLPEATLADTWKAQAVAAGAFQSFGQPRIEKLGGSRIADIPCLWERQTLNLRIVTDEAGRISGLWLLPAGR